MANRGRHNMSCCDIFCCFKEVCSLLQISVISPGGGWAGWSSGLILLLIWLHWPHQPGPAHTITNISDQIENPTRLIENPKLCLVAWGKKPRNKTTGINNIEHAEPCQDLAIRRSSVDSLQFSGSHQAGTCHGVPLSSAQHSAAYSHISPEYKVSCRDGYRW